MSLHSVDLMMVAVICKDLQYTNKALKKTNKMDVKNAWFKIFRLTKMRKEMNSKGLLGL